MEIVNSTGFPFGAVASRLHFPGHSVTLIVKATFALAPDGTVTPVEEQPFLNGDLPYDGDGVELGAPRVSSDFVPTKPNTDIGFAGRCHSPAEVTRCEVGLKVGEFDRRLLVLGDRHWEAALLGGKPSEPAPFREMELRYERALGGPKLKANPIGSGHKLHADDPLPNLAWTEELADLPEPAGFGPIGHDWAYRKKKLGTYKKSYVKTRWPWFAEDFDPTYFNAAPPAMQMQGYLRGDETVELDNLNAEHPRLRTRLPAIRVRCFVEQLPTAIDASVAEPKFLEVAMVLDTLFVDGDAGQLSLVWRGNAEVEDEDFEDVRRVFVMAESLAESPASVGACRAAMQEFLVEDDLYLEDEDLEVIEEEGVGEIAPKAEEREDPEVAGLLQQVEDAKKRAGIDDDSIPDLTSDERRDVARLLLAAGMSTEEVLGTGVSRAELPPDTAEERMKQAELREHIGAPESDAPPEPAPFVAPPTYTRLNIPDELAGGNTFEGQDLSNLDLSYLDLRGVTIEGADLTGVKLVGTDLSGSVLDGVILTDADLSGAVLVEVNFAGSTCSGTNFARANLTRADLTGAELSDAVFNESNVEEAVFQESKLEGAKFVGARATDADFAGADLSGATFANATMDGSNLSGCRLDAASFRAASMVDTTLNGARGEGVDLSEANLTGLRASDGTNLPGANFKHVQAARAKFESAVLDGADFTGSVLTDANFSKASLTDLDLTGCVLKFARFRKASLVRAKLVGADAYEGNFERADLTGADLRGASMYSAEFLHAILDDAKTEGADFKMTKLA